MLFADGEPGAEVIAQRATVANKHRVQIAQEMINNSRHLRSRSRVLRNVVQYKSSWYKSISAEAYTKHGLNCHAVIFDELHTQPNRDLWDVLTTSTGARRQPLVMALTTAGHDRASICYEVHEYAKKVRDGIIKDDTFLPVLYAADIDDDWTDEATWRKANPGLAAFATRTILNKPLKMPRPTRAWLIVFYVCT